MENLLEQNRKWAAEKLAADPDYFSRHAKGQKPKYLWLGCSDSRVPPEKILGLEIGEIFVHRNIANLVQADDNSVQSVLQYAIEALKVEHIVVCGHYGCGGVAAACDCSGTIQKWLAPVRTLYESHPNASQQELVELNVKQQVENIAQSPIYQNAKTELHAWVYDIETGLLKCLR